MYVAMMDSESRTWVALGKTEAEAKNAILTAWNEHQQTMESNRWMRDFENDGGFYYETAEDLEEDYQITVVELKAGECQHW